MPYPPSSPRHKILNNYTTTYPIQISYEEIAIRGDLSLTAAAPACTYLHTLLVFGSIYRELPSWGRRGDLIHGTFGRSLLAFDWRTGICVLGWFLVEYMGGGDLRPNSTNETQKTEGCYTSLVFIMMIPFPLFSTFIVKEENMQILSFVKQSNSITGEWDWVFIHFASHCNLVWWSHFP